MNRRAFVPGLEAVWCVVSIVLCVIFGLLSVPAGKAQQPQRPYRIGWLSLGSHSTPYLAALRESLRGLGYAEGTDFVFDGLWAGGKEELLPKLADELVAKRVDLIVASGDQVIKAAKRATATIPIVMIACDAMEAGLV